MLFTVIGDPHAKPDNLDKINKLFDIIEELGNPCILLGDLLDTKELVRGKCLNTYIERMGASKLNFIVLVGNHDWFNLDCKDHSLESLNLLSNVTLIDRPTELEGVTYLPYIHEKHLLIRYLKQAKGAVFCHADAVGFDYGNGHISENGIRPEDFSEKPIIISGHYHKYQKAGNFIYLGTPFSHSFGETDQEKFIGLFNSSHNSLELLDSPFPQHRTHEVKSLEEDKLRRLLDEISKTLDYHRVILHLGPEGLGAINPKDWPTVKFIIKPFKTKAETSIIKETDSPEVQFAKWAKELKKLPKEVVALGLEILKDV